MNLSRMEAGAKSVTQSNDFVVHALRRDADGMLQYTKVSSGSTDVADFHRLDGTQYPGFLDGEDYVDETPEDKAYKNDVNDKYQQYRFDFRNLNYLIDSDGYLVARVNGSYDHETTGPQ